jgi:hypothetical protein
MSIWGEDVRVIWQNSSAFQTSQSRIGTNLVGRRIGHRSESKARRQGGSRYGKQQRNEGALGDADRAGAGNGGERHRHRQFLALSRVKPRQMVAARS